MGVLRHWRKFCVWNGFRRRQLETVHTSVGKWLEGDTRSFLRACHLHWKAFALHSKLSLNEENLQEHEQETSAFIAQLESERMVKDSKLSSLYTKLDRGEETLQKEIRAKQELAAKLQDAHKQMQHVGMSMSIVARPGTPPESIRPRGVTSASHGRVPDTISAAVASAANGFERTHAPTLAKTLGPKAAIRLGDLKITSAANGFERTHSPTLAKTFASDEPVARRGD